MYIYNRYKIYNHYKKLILPPDICPFRQISGFFFLLQR